MSSEPDATALRRITRAGDYDLLRKMGSGGFGVVYEARHRQTGLLFAIKRIDLSVEDAERFRREALYPAQIASRSLHVLGVHSFFHDPDSDAFYLVTELIPHGDLKTFLAQRPKPLPLSQAVHLGSGIAKGLAAIHALGIVHLDVKPANVLMDKKDGQWVPKIADFGLARSHSSISLGEFASSGYASPEQLDLVVNRLGVESDLFSFGMVLYELLTGQPATPASDLREYARWIKTRRPPPPPSTVRPELARFVAIDTMVASLLEFEPARRTTSATTCTKVLQDALLALARPAAPRPPTPPPSPVQVGPPPMPAPVEPPAPAATPAPTPAPLPLAAVFPALPAVPVAPVAIPPMPVPAPVVTPPLAKPRSSGRGLGWFLALAAVVILGVLGAAGWWGWRLYDLRDAAARGQQAFRGSRFTTALPLLKKAADSGDAASQGLLGEIYAMGLGVRTDVNEARRWFELAAAQDHPSGIAGRGWSLLYGHGVAADPERGVELLRQAANRGDAFGHTYLAMAYENGLGTARNEPEAARQYESGADQLALASYRLARMYRDGRGVPRSPEDAMRWARKAAAVGYYNGMCLLGNLLGARYEQARGRVRTAPDADAREAVGWYRKAANDQIACGELGLGYMSYYGYGTEASYDQAVTLYERAAAHGDETAKSNLTDAMGNWVLPPMFLGNWRQVGGDERREEIQHLRSAGIIDRIGVRDVQRLRRIEVGFYDRATLFELEVARPNRANGIYAYIRRGDRVIPIDGRAAPIHEQNGSAPLRLDTMSRAMEYLRFFMAAVQSSQGTFRVVDDTRDVAWLPTATDQDRSGISGQIFPASISPSSSGGWQAMVATQYGNGVFRASMWLKPNGEVEMLRDEPIGTLLPIAQERFDDQGLRVRVSN